MSDADEGEGGDRSGPANHEPVGSVGDEAAKPLPLLRYTREALNVLEREALGGTALSHGLALEGAGDGRTGDAAPRERDEARSPALILDLVVGRSSWPLPQAGNPPVTAPQCPRREGALRPRA